MPGIDCVLEGDVLTQWAEGGSGLVWAASLGRHRCLDVSVQFPTVNAVKAGTM